MTDTMPPLVEEEDEGTTSAGLWGEHTQPPHHALPPDQPPPPAGGEEEDEPSPFSDPTARFEERVIDNRRDVLIAALALLSIASCVAYLFEIALVAMGRPHFLLNLRLSSIHSEL